MRLRVVVSVTQMTNKQGNRYAHIRDMTPPTLDFSLKTVPYLWDNTVCISEMEIFRGLVMHVHVHKWY